MCLELVYISIFFFTDTATTEIYTLSLHDALPISIEREDRVGVADRFERRRLRVDARGPDVQRMIGRKSGADLEIGDRSEEHTSELQSRRDLVCRLLLEKKKQNTRTPRNRPIIQSN